MPLELVSDEETVVVTEVIKTYSVIIDDEVETTVIVEPETVVEMPNETALFQMDTPGPPGNPGIVASQTAPVDPFVGMLWVDLP